MILEERIKNLEDFILSLGWNSGYNEFFVDKDELFEIQNKIKESREKK